jgi:hypothetical protein
VAKQPKKARFAQIQYMHDMMRNMETVTAHFDHVCLSLLQLIALCENLDIRIVTRFQAVQSQIGVIKSETDH